MLPPVRRLPTGFRLLALAAGVALASGAAAASAGRPPNIVFIMADDLGYGDLGCYGQRIIRTPNLDRLAAGGMRFTQHYAGAPVCGPSRCVLLTGKHPGHAFIRGNAEVGTWDSFEGQMPLPAGEHVVAEWLHAAGYATGAFGKWGLGGVGSSGDPLRHGFDRFFGYNCQRHAHSYYPQYLIDDAAIRPLPGNVGRIGRTESVVPVERADDPAAYAPFSGGQYSPDLCREEALTFLRAHRDRPFFLYYPTTIPHLALQVPDDDLAEYRGRLPDRPYRGGDAYLPQQYPHAAYAAMLTHLDRDVGRIVGLVRELGLEDNTIIIFTSDNGAVYPLGGFDPGFFHSNGNLRGYKGSVYEGGIREPLIVRWPGHIPAGTTSDFVSGFEDWLPTLLELADVNQPAALTGDGISLVPTLLGRTQPARPFLYREIAEYTGQQSIRVGNWKAVRQNLGGSDPVPAGASTAVQLYDLGSDPAERNDVAAAHPDVVRQLATLLRREHVPSAEFPLVELDRTVAAEHAAAGRTPAPRRVLP